MTVLPKTSCAMACKVEVVLRSALWVLILTLAVLPDSAMAVRSGTRQGLVADLAARSTLYHLVRLEAAVETYDARLQKLEAIYEPELVMDLPWQLRLTTIVRLRGDVVDELEPGRPDQPEVAPVSRSLALADRIELALRELYVEATIGRTFLTLGKQQIVWGKADGLKVLDVVNPQSFREFILEDFDRSRLPLLAVNAEVPIADVVLQLLWLPEQTYHDLPTPDAAFALTSPLFTPETQPGGLVEVHDLERPNRFFRDSDVGARLTTFWKGWDLTVNYLYHYDDLPVPFRSSAPSPTGPLVTVTPRYKRTHLLGGSFSKAFGDFVVRGEVGFLGERFLPTNEPTEADGVIETQALETVVGLDWSGLTETLVSVQGFQSVITDRPPGVFRDRVESVVTVLVRRDFLYDRVLPELSWLHSLNRGDGLLRPRVRYELSSPVMVWMGADIFYGTRDGFFGQFNRASRVVLGLTWGL